MQQGDIVVTNYDASSVSGMYILKEVCYLTTSIAAIHFFYGNVIISREHLKYSICQRHCVYFTTSFTVIQGAYLFQRTYCNDICLKSNVFNARKHLQPFPPWSPDIGDYPHPNLQVLGKTQTRVFPIPGFLVNLLYKKTVIIPEPAMILTWNLDP